MVIPIGAQRSKAFIIKEEKTILVDTSAAISIETLLSDFKRHNIRPEDLSLIIITHGHTDHFELLPELKKITKAPVACHKKAYEHLINGTNSPVVIQSGIGKILLKLFGMKAPDYREGVEADILIEDEMDLKEYGVNGKLLSTPGHTECSLSIVTKNKEAIIGDFLLDMPFQRSPNYSFIAQDMDIMRASMKKLLNTKCSVFYSSHAKSYKRDEFNKLEGQR